MNRAKRPARFTRISLLSALLGSVVAITILVTACLKLPGQGDADDGDHKITTVAERASCLQCHQPLGSDGEPTGLEDVHPWFEITCVECHGGNPDDITVAGAHVPQRGSPKFLKNLTALELDEVDQEYLRFINPGDMRAVPQTCGTAGCHPEMTDMINSSMMSHTTGEITVARYRAGAQDTELAIFGALDLFDPNFDPTIPTTVETISLFNPEPPLPPDGPIENLQEYFGIVQDYYMETSCFRCHFGDFGENKLKGDFRSSGCSACHMVYADDGLSRSNDVLIDHERTPHPIKHQLTSQIPIFQCTHCHYRGGRLGIAYQGYRESAGSGFNPTNTATLGIDNHGHDVNYYITDEDLSNDYDETPPDVHFEAGMACIDCHTLFDVHGDGHLYSDTPAAVEIRCTSCHGTPAADSDLLTSRGRTLTNVEKDAKGDYWLTGKLDGIRREVPQIARMFNLAPEDDKYSAAAIAAHGQNAGGFSHTESLECYTCHASWYMSCYGCHVTIDFTGTARSLVTGEEAQGRASGKRKWVVIDDLVLMVNSRGLISPSQPAERFFLTVIDADGETVLDSMPRMAADGTPGMGQRAYNPHTTQRVSPFSSCDRCHPKADGSNQEMVDVAAGFGSERYPHTDGNGRLWQLDAIQTREYEPLVTVGHNEPEEMRPLDREIVERMMGVVLPVDE